MTKASASPSNVAGEGYYIYGLIDPVARHQTGEDLLSIFYVGKGKDARWFDHEKSVLTALEKEVVLLEREGSKAQRIQSILEQGGRVQAVRLAGGFVNEQDAYAAESLAIETVNRILRIAQRPLLTNATPGHHAGFISLTDHFHFVTTTERDVPSTSGKTGVSGPRSALLVKGTREALTAGQQRLLPAYSFGSGLDAVRDRITTLQWVEDPSSAYSRRAWDPQDPWTDEEARERGRRYWTLGTDRVNRWIKDPDTCPEVLLLGIPDGHQTVVRYAWEIDRDGTWEYFPSESGAGWWGVPLGKRRHKEPTLGTALYETRENGKRVQVLAGYAAGWRVLDV